MNQADTWQPELTDTPMLAPGDIHVWRVRLDVAAGDFEGRYQLLASDERERADRFHFSIHRQRFVAGRAALRCLLGRILCRAPEELIFDYSRYGKPSLAGASGPDDLRFNTSNSEDLALIAVSREREVGVDLEFMRDGRRLDGIAERFFASGEVETLLALEPGRRRVAFYACWTRKEAYIKAVGAGLSMPLDAFEVSLAPDEAVALLMTHHDPAEVVRWSMVALQPGSGFAGALCVEGKIGKMSCWE